MPTDTFESLAASDTIGGIFVVQFNTSAWLWCRDWDLSHIYGVEPATGSQSATSGRIGMVDDGGSFNLYMLRAFLNFDTSALPDNATITGVTLRLYVSAKQDTGSASPTIGVTGYTGTNTPAQWDANSASQTLWTSVTATELATRVALSAITAGQYVDIPLNSSGLAAISKTGRTKLAVRGNRDLDMPSYSGSPGSWPKENITINTGDNSSNKPQLQVTYTTPATPVYISGSSSAAATGSLSLTANQLLSGSSNAAASASLSLTTGGPATITPSASNSTATGSFSIASGRPLGSLAANATASGTLNLGTTSAVGSRAAPGWLGMFVLDSSGSSVPLIAGGASATATGTLSLLTPSPQTISGSSQARAIASMLLTVLRGGAALIIRDTYVTSAQFGAKTVSSDTFGDRTVYVHPESTIS